MTAATARSIRRVECLDALVIRVPRESVRGEALDEARAAIATWLQVEPDAFDVEVG